jgi:hypothetical protein
VEVVADLAAVVGVALEDVAGVPVLDQALGQGQAGQATAGDEDVQWFGDGDDDLLLGVAAASAGGPDQPVEE